MDSAGKVEVDEEAQVVTSGANGEWGRHVAGGLGAATVLVLLASACTCRTGVGAVRGSVPVHSQAFRLGRGDA